MISFSKFNLENKDILLCSQVSNFGLGLVQVLIAEKGGQGIILVYIPSPPILPSYMELCEKWGWPDSSQWPDPPEWAYPPGWTYPPRWPDPPGWPDPPPGWTDPAGLTRSTWVTRPSRLTETFLGGQTCRDDQTDQAEMEKAIKIAQIQKKAQKY